MCPLGFTTGLSVRCRNVRALFYLSDVLIVAALSSTGELAAAVEGRR